MEPEGRLARDLEKELISRDFTPARPVGLRYDRLAKDGLAAAAAGPWTADSAPGAGGTGTRGAGIVGPKALDARTLEEGTRGNGTCGAGTREASHWYFLTNQLLISRLLAPCRRVLVACAESWPASLLCCQEIKILSTTVSAGSTDLHASAGSSFESRNSFIDSGVSASGSGKAPFDGILADSSILLSDNVAQRLAQFRVMLTPGGKICIVAVNWKYEMADRDVTYETSFRRYGGNVYLGLVKRTLLPAKEVEYISLLDPGYSLVRKLASMERDELRRLTIMDVPGVVAAITSVELIEIPQFTSESLREACESALYSDVLVSGAPGILALRLFKRFPLLAEKAFQNLVVAYPFVGPIDNPHIIAICRP